MATTAEPVVLINAFEVPVGDDERFVAGWERARSLLSEQPGYLETTLHRSLSPDAEFRFVNVARWETAEAFQAATSKLDARAFPYRFHAALYEVVAT